MKNKKQMFCAGEPVTMVGVRERAEVLNVNKDGTVDIVWDRGGYTCNVDPDDLVKIEEEE